MYKTIKVFGTEPGQYGNESSYSSKIVDAIEKINVNRGKIIAFNQIEVPQYQPSSMGNTIKFMSVTAVIVYEV